MYIMWWTRGSQWRHAEGNNMVGKTCQEDYFCSSNQNGFKKGKPSLSRLRRKRTAIAEIRVNEWLNECFSCGC